jgi:hypothetical protein
MSPESQGVPSAVSNSTGVLAAAMAIDGGSVAMIRATADDRQTLSVGPSAGPLRPILTSATIAAPTWEPDHSGVLVALDGRRFGYAPSGRPVITAAAAGLDAILGPAGRLTALRLAPDGIHLAFVVSDGSTGQVLTGLFHSGASTASVTNLRTVSSRIAGAADVAWTLDNNTLITFGRDTRGEVVQDEIVADGSGELITVATGLHDVPTAIAALPKRSTVLVAAGGHIYQEFNRGWASPENPRPVPGASIFYPS